MKLEDYCAKVMNIMSNFSKNLKIFFHYAKRFRIFVFTLQRQTLKYKTVAVVENSFVWDQEGVERLA